MASGTKLATLRVAVTQHEPVWLDLDATVDKTVKIIAEAAATGAKLVTFPECWIPGYPAWIWYPQLRTVLLQRKLIQGSRNRPVDFDLGVRYIENCIAVNSPQFKRIQDAAAENAIAVALGFSERDGNSVYIAQALIASTGDIAMKRRKMKPTHMERTIFGDASGDCLAPVVKLNAEGRVDDPGVNVGSLSCWEHIQPLLKYYTFSQGEQVHVAAWPPLDPFIQGSPGLWSMSVEGCLNLSQTYAVESQSYVLHCTTVITEKGVESMRTAGTPIMGSSIAGSSAIVGPDGRVLSAPDSPNEQLIVADLDLSQVVKAKTFADASGHYSRPDMLWLGADPTLKPVVRVEKTA